MRGLLSRLLLLAVLPFGAFVALIPEGSTPAEPLPVLYPYELDGAHTGGFGEPTCHSCHFDYEVNNGRGRVALEGLHEAFQPEAVYDITVVVQSEQLKLGGFQLSARFEDGSQAGTFSWDADRVMLTPGISDELQYVQHTAASTSLVDERKVTWEVSWRAPEMATGPVYFNVAGNAANDDDSAFGDWIYVEEVVVTPRK